MNSLKLEAFENQERKEPFALKTQANLLLLSDFVETIYEPGESL